MFAYECPTCSRVIHVACRTDAPHRPFCCERCKLVDLGRWLDGTYCISEPMWATDPDPEMRGEWMGSDDG